MRFVVVIVAAALSFGAGCGRESFLLIGITRTEGGNVVSTSLSYDQKGRVLSVEKADASNPDGDALVFDRLNLTWADDGKLTAITRTEPIAEELAFITTTTLTYDQDVVVAVESISRFTEDEAERDPRRSETFTLTYDKAKRIETLAREAEEEDGDTESTFLTFTHDVPGLIQLRDETELRNVRDADVEFVRTTDVTFEGDKPTKLAVAVDDGRETIFDITYKGATLEEMDVAIPDNDDFGNEITRRGRIVYEYDELERMDTVRIEEDDREDIEIELEYTDGNASGIDTAPAEIAPLPLWDLRGTSFKFLDARLQAPRLLGATW